MNLPELSRAFFNIIDKRIGPFDRPIQFRPFPFDSGGALNFLTLGAGHEQFVTYVSWDLFGHEKQKRGSLGRYELLITCDNEQWCLDVLTNIGRQTLVEVFEPGDTMDITPWAGVKGSVPNLDTFVPCRLLFRTWLANYVSNIPVRFTTS